MFSKKKRDTAYIARLEAFLAERYALPACRVSPCERGFYGETWRAESGGRAYFVKVVCYRLHMSDYMESFRVIEYLRERGITHISEPIPDAQGNPFNLFEDGVLAVFAFVEGVHTEDYPLEPLFALLARQYRVDVGELAPIRTERFSCGTLRDFRREAERLARSEIPEAAQMLALLSDRRNELAHTAAFLRRAAALCRGSADAFCITSGDVGGNVIVRDGRMTIIDWDSLMLAPPERDLWFYMWSDEQIELIDRVLPEHGFPYALRPERFAFYACSQHFFYLTEYVEAFFNFPEAREEALALFAAHLDDYMVPRALQKAEALLKVPPETKDNIKE